MSLPADLISDEILVRLPVKSLMRFKLVSKSWNAQISSDPIFRRSYGRKRSSSSGRDNNGSSVRVLVVSPLCGPLITVDTTGTPVDLAPALPAWSQFSITCQDLVLLQHHHDSIRVWNPSTRDVSSNIFKDIGPSSARSKIVLGFGYIESTEKYNLLFATTDLEPSRCLMRGITQHPSAAFHTLTRPNVSAPPFIVDNKGATVDSTVYLLPAYSSAKLDSIAVFDLEKDEWKNKLLPMPPGALSHKLYNLRLTNLSGSLCMMGCGGIMWIRNECGWVEHVIDLPTRVLWSVSPVTVLKDGRIMLFVNRKPLPTFFYYDPRGCIKIEEVPYPGKLPRVSIPGLGPSTFNEIVYTEGLANPMILSPKRTTTISSPKRTRDHPRRSLHSERSSKRRKTRAM